MTDHPTPKRDVALVVAGDPVGVEAVERRAERRPLAQDRQPRQAGLERLEAEPLEQPLLVADGHAPLGVVVLPQQGVARRPRRTGQPVVAQHQCRLHGRHASADHPPGRMGG